MTTPHLRTQLPGAFIVIEGVDGAGKTTVAQRLAAELDSHKDFNGALYVREPGSTPFGSAVRKAFLETDTPLDPLSEVFALIACKNELLKKVIRPAVAAGQIVVCDRYTRTLMAYQGGVRGVPYEYLRSLLEGAGILDIPNMELFLEVDEATSRARRNVALNIMDKVAEEKATALREGFAQGRAALPSYLSKDIDASGTPDEVYTKVQEEVLRYLKFHRVAGLGNPQVRIPNEAIRDGSLDSLNPDNEEVIARLSPRRTTDAGEAEATPAETADAAQNAS